MIKKKKYLFGSIICGLLSMSICTGVAQAAENPTSVVEEYVEAMNEQNWSNFTNLHCAEEKNSFQEFFGDEANASEHIGVQNVKNATLVETVEVELEDVADMLYKNYKKDSTKIFVFGVDYEVYEDSKYYSTGINYNFITLVQEEGEWKVSEMLPISNPSKLIESGYELTENFATTIDVMSACLVYNKTVTKCKPKV